MAHLTRLLALLLFAVTTSNASAQVSGCTANDPDIACTLQDAVRGIVEAKCLRSRAFLMRGQAPSECDETGRKSPQQDRSHKLWREANGGAQCGKSARCVRRGGLWRRGVSLALPGHTGAPALDPTVRRTEASSRALAAPPPTRQLVKPTNKAGQPACGVGGAKGRGRGECASASPGRAHYRMPCRPSDGAHRNFVEI